MVFGGHLESVHTEQLDGGCGLGAGRGLDFSYIGCKEKGWRGFRNALKGVLGLAPKGD